ncbi:hypothetical protein [Paenibacillus sp. J22TS3]|uniref:hypothetical protein n=1 Tax=Paenibacillus sp. J22TS3 TaxID=2807192 RepID=UPI001BCBD9CE|nr:hypothetical protein [Paenibacillus sp. J22TS3]
MLEVLKRTEDGDEEPYRHAFEKLNAQTESFILREAHRWSVTYRKYRIYEDDFESEFRFVVAKAALAYDGRRGSFFDLLRTSVRNKGRDMVRRALTEKNRINHLAQSIEDETVLREVERKYPVPSAESVAVNRATIAEMAADQSLNEQERAVLDLLRVDPDTTLQEIADALGLRDRKQAQRVRRRMADKLRKYIEG